VSTRGVRDQFGPSARAYVASERHASGPDLARLVELAAPRGHEVFLDVATGAGHTLRAFSGRVGVPIGLDATDEMLRAARRLVADRRARFIQGDVFALPLRDASVDTIACRLAAHHFPDVRRAFAEIVRVLRPGGAFLLVDNYAPDDRALDAFLNALERTRDATHVREHRLAEWLALVRGSGLHCEVADRYQTPIEVAGWLARSRTPPDRAATVRRLLAGAPADAVRELAITADSFTLRKAILVGRKP